MSHPDSGTSGRRRPFWRRALGAALDLLWMLALLEGASRLLLANQAVFARVRGGSDSAWRLEWVRRQSQGVEIDYPIDIYHPTRGWALRANVRGAGVFGPGSVNSNSAGLRGLDEVDSEREGGRFRIVVLGDSFTFGDEVRDDETYVSRLREALPGIEVLNLGVHGYGHDQMLVYLREQGLALRPDLVILGFVRDDMRRNLLEFRDYAKPRFGIVDGRLAARRIRVPPPEELLAREPFRPRLFDLADMTYQAYLWKVGINQRRMERLTEALLDAAVEESVTVGAPTVFVYLPHGEEITDPDITLEEERFFADYCEERAAYCLNLRPEFLRAVASGSPLKRAGHWHAGGHRLAAEAIAGYLVERRLVTR